MPDPTDTPARQLGRLRARLTSILAHLAVRQPCDAALCDLLAVQAQLEAIAELSADGGVSMAARTLAMLVRDLRGDIELLQAIGPEHMTTWEAGR